MSFLKPFYKRAYDELRKILPKEVAIVFHDGFRLGSWNETAGWFYWNYQLLRDEETPTDEFFKESWDFKRNVKRGWFSIQE